MVDAGLVSTINTDDPSISRITLSGEMQLINDEFGFGIPRLKELTMNAVNAAFASKVEKEKLVTQFKKGLE